MRRPIIVRHKIRSTLWSGPVLKVVVLSDLHVVAPWVSLPALARVVERVQALQPDLILLPGDFLADPKLFGRRAQPGEIVALLSALSAPYGVHATLGNHDWADCQIAQATGGARNSVAEAFEKCPITLYTNTARDLGPFWIAGLDSAVGAGSSERPKPRHDLSAALAAVPDGASTILMAHEPDIWLDKEPDVALTVSGHTHGGQIVLGNWRPLTPSRYGGRLAHGLQIDGDRHLVVSGGLGYSGIPLRIGVPPEITLIELAGSEGDG
ncbi:MAG: metallophosphoesterase [Pseudomonadota bacterium]